MKEDGGGGGGGDKNVKGPEMLLNCLSLFNQ